MLVWIQTDNNQDSTLPDQMSSVDCVQLTCDLPKIFSVGTQPSERTDVE